MQSTWEFNLVTHRVTEEKSLFQAEDKSCRKGQLDVSDA